MAQLRNSHPGEILKEEFLNEIGMSQNQLAHAIGVPGNRIHAIVNGTRDITGDTDLRLCKFFGLSEGYFLRKSSTRRSNDPTRTSPEGWMTRAEFGIAGFALLFLLIGEATMSAIIR